MGEFGQCEKRERYWTLWIESRLLLDQAGSHLEIAKFGERAARSLLNHHMLTHHCGNPVEPPSLDGRAESASNQPAIQSKLTPK